MIEALVVKIQRIFDGVVNMRKESFHTILNKNLQKRRIKIKRQQVLNRMHFNNFIIHT